MKQLISIIGTILVIILILFSVLYSGRNLLVKKAIVIAVNRTLNLESSVEQVEIEVRESKITIHRFRVFNPSGFDYPHLAVFNRIFSDYEFQSLYRPPFRSFLLEIDLGEIVIIRDAEGRLNLKEIISPEKVIKKQKDSLEDIDPAADKTVQDRKENFHIDVLVLSIDRVVFVDYFKETEGKIRTIPVGMRNHVYEDVISLDELARLILVEAVIRSGLTNLEELLDPLVAGLAEMISSLPDELKLEYEDKISSQLERFEDKSKEYIERIQEQIGPIPDEAMDLFRRILPNR